MTKLAISVALPLALAAFMSLGGCAAAIPALEIAATVATPIAQAGIQGFEQTHPMGGK